MSGKAKFTPGPWSVEDPMGPDVLSIVANGDKPTYDWRHVAQVSCDDEPGPGAIHKTEMEANARLIGAAPELYECLTQFVNAYQTGLLDSPADETLANVVARSVAALAKAGRTR